MSENKILAAVAESLKQTHNAVNQANNTLGVIAREFLYRSMLERELSSELIAMEAAMKGVQESIRRQQELDATLAKMDPKSRIDYKALLEENRARIEALLNDKLPRR
ncbi:hypothetical protein HF679_09700 [Enterobacter sp. JUb54]|uniref:hypothetical protein n=1 Tax=Enterobacter sp. JUb54 TaxID=2724468 RepID=UPI00164CF186|nr:hypothetical protein [Enterobacter sp. JUb54]QNK09675.1 hypothetical protein HF679_09700 [Enterobacter sp. JUb54]